MNDIEALDFLKQHQLMLSDLEIEKSIIDKYDEVRKYFLKNRNPECVQLFLNSFGEISGFGVYQLVEDVIRKYNADEVIRDRDG